MTPKDWRFWLACVFGLALWAVVCRSEVQSGPLMIAVPTATPLPAGMTLFSFGPGYAAMWVPTEFAEGIVGIIT